VLCAANGDCAPNATCDTSSGACVVAGQDAGVDVGVDQGVDVGVDQGVDVGVDQGVDQGVDVATRADLGVADAITPPPFVAPQISSTAARCVRDADCSTGHCVEGICCDAPCDEPCHSCALLPTLGKCTVEPLGTDLRNDCGPSLSCLGTCDGAGQCIGAGPGTTCARNRCTSIAAGVGPAYCAAAGSACDIANVGSFNCSPFACSAAFGACLTACATTEDCDNGYVCDTSSSKCVTATAASGGGGGGCAFAHVPTQTNTSSLFAVAIAIALAARRRSVRA
jgi:hypothetical protein